jgi:hypothetical protein
MERQVVSQFCSSHHSRRDLPASPSQIFIFLSALFLSGCSMAPKSFLSMNDPTAINRARAVAYGQSEPDAVAIPVLIDRLSDDDPVVRLASHEALKRRTGQNFGYQPYIEGDELASAVQRWKTWWASTNNGRMFAGRPQASPQASPQTRQSNKSPRPVSEATYLKKHGPFQRLFGRN